MRYGLYKKFLSYLSKWYKGWGLAAKLFFLLFLATVTIFMMLQWSNLREAKRLLKKQVVSDAQLMILRTNQFLDAYLDNIKNVLFLISSQQGLLEEGREKEVMDFLRICGEYNSSIIKTLYIIRSDGKVYSSNQILYDILGNQHLKGLYEFAQDGYVGVSWVEPYETSLSGRTIAFTLPIRDKRNTTLGIAVVEINIDYLTQRISPWLVSRNQSFIVTSPDNNLVVYDLYSSLLPYEAGIYPPVITRDFINLIGEKPAGINYMDIGNKFFMLVKSNANNLNWNLAVIIDQEALHQNVSKLYYNFIITALLWVVVLFVGSFLLSYYFTNPIRKLASRMDKVKDLESLPVLDMDRGDEIGQLAKSYNAMMKRINALVNEIKTAEAQKKEFELKMLQSQIGPHFLYNTLACIGSLAKQQKIMEVRETIRSLVGLLSFSFDKRSELVTLKEEIDSLIMYVNIQKIRYGDIFKLELDIEPEALSCRILKLTLQPIVENAIFHGLAPKHGSGIVCIRARVVRNVLKISIRDNGVGMNKNECKDLLECRVNKQLHDHDRFNSIGISNVHERIQIHFGTNYGLRISGRKNVGTVVHIDIPAIQ